MAARNAVIIISDSPSAPSSPEHAAVELDLSDAELDRFLQESSEEPQLMPPVLRSDAALGGGNEATSRCEEAVLACFPDICRDYLKSEAAKHEWDSQRLISHLLDEQEKGNAYPKQPNPLKRKRPDNDQDPEEDMRKRFERADPRLARKGRDYVRLHTKAAHRLLKASFPDRYAEDIERLLKENDYQLYSTYLALDKASWDPDAEPIRVKKVGTRREHPEALLRDSVIEAEMDALAAFDAARSVCEAKAQARAGEKRKQEEEEENEKRARTEGTIAECGCCFDEKPLNRMVHCDAESTCHWFCLACAKQMAEHAVGLSKYQLTCMSMDGCNGGFSRSQRALFLDDKLATALELIEQETVLRLAGIENLATCPFCPFAAEYPPVAENKEFRCENSECGIVSCRLCRQETHIPKTCGEAAKERGHSARRAIEEAMSAALIRKCNKCGTPFIKEHGCNKMTCTAPGCRNVQCYVCHKSCDYTHFDDSSRGGKKGNCPLFDSVEQRHEDEVKAAEEEARKKIAEENPNVDADALLIDFSDKVKQDDERRKAADPNARRAFAPPPAPIVVRPLQPPNRPRDLPGPGAPRDMPRPEHRDLPGPGEPRGWVEPLPLPNWMMPFGNLFARPAAPAAPAQPAAQPRAQQPAAQPQVQQPAAQPRAQQAAAAVPQPHGYRVDRGARPGRFARLEDYAMIDPLNRQRRPVPAAAAAEPIDQRPQQGDGRDAGLAGNDRLSILARASTMAANHVRNATAAHIRASRMFDDRVRDVMSAHNRAAARLRRGLDLLENPPDISGDALLHPNFEYAYNPVPGAVGNGRQGNNPPQGAAAAPNPGPNRNAGVARAVPPALGPYAVGVWERGGPRQRDRHGV